MLTPQEVSEHVFAKASFGGYNMAMVDDFLDQLTEDYTALYKENATLKAKMKVLVDKLEEYRSTEDAMRKALLTAQRMADDMVHEAEEQRESLIRNARADAEDEMARLRQQVADEQARLSAAQTETAAYVDKLRELYQHELDFLGSLSGLTASAQPAAPEEDTAREIEQNVERAIAEEDLPVPADTEEEVSLYDELTAPRAGDVPDEDDEDNEPTRRIDFSNLQFGKDYEIR